MRPPRSPRVLLRLLALLFALGQGVVPAAAAIAEGALLEASWGRQAAAHVEPVGGSDCHRVHTDACELCRLLSLQRAVPPAPGIPPASERRAVAWAPPPAPHRGGGGAPRARPPAGRPPPGPGPPFGRPMDQLGA